MKMKNLLSGNLLYVTIIIVALNISFNAYAQKKPGNTQQTDAIKLEYKYLKETPIKYLSISKMTQTMDIQGQSMQNNINSVFGCSIKATGKQDSDLKLEIKLDTLGQVVESPMGTAGGSVRDIQGKVINIVISPDGRETDISEAEKVIYTVEGSGESNVSQTFMEFFPILPIKPVKVGDTWNIADSVASTNGATFTKNIVNSTDKLEGIENIDGIECARISSTLSGTMIINTQNQGMDVKMKGTYTGSGILLFAIKEGYFIKQTVISKVTGNVEIAMPESVTFPMVMDVNTVNEVIK
jgi:hypothetical protein